MSAFQSRSIRPHSHGAKAKHAVQKHKQPDLRLAKEFHPFGHKATRKVEGKIFRAAGDLVLLGILENGTLSGSQLAREFEWLTGEQVPLSGIYQKLGRLREQGRIEDQPIVQGGQFVRGIWMAGSTRPARITQRGRSALNVYRSAMGVFQNGNGSSH